MSPLHRRNASVDKLIKDSAQLRAQLTATVAELEKFVEQLSQELEEQEPEAGEDT